MQLSPSPGGVRPWWTDAVVYQVYVRSFADANGDGIGDLDGIRSRLDHLASLGVDAIWLNPCYPSPQLDHGYDVADYFAIEPDYGTLEVFDALVTEAHRRDIRLLMDIVPNHCSHEHPWFRAALESPPGSPERARFYFRDGRGEHKEEPPNNWRAMFGGSAWTPVGDGQWYLGTFTGHQPDFDHTNPEVAELFDEVLRFWFDRGADGFRVDAVSHLGKAPELPDAPPVPPGTAETDVASKNPFAMFRPEGHAVWRRWRRVTDEYMAAHPGRELVMVAEAYTPRRPDLLLEFARPDEFHQCFAFDLILSPWEPQSLRQAVEDQLMLLNEHDVMPTWTLNNHDCQRIVTRLGREGITSSEAYTGNNLVYLDTPVDLEAGTNRARALVALVLALPGSVYLYQGEELGLPEVLDLPDEVRHDPIFVRTGGSELGRDGCRVPLPWTRDPADAHGFSLATPTAPPWLPQPRGWGDRSVEAQLGDPHSMLDLYRRLLSLRRQVVLAEGAAAWMVDVGPHLVGVRRGRLLAVMNPTADARVANGTAGLDVVASTGTGAPRDAAAHGHDDHVVPADTTVWLLGT